MTKSIMANDDIDNLVDNVENKTLINADKRKGALALIGSKYYTIPHFVSYPVSIFSKGVIRWKLRSSGTELDFRLVSNSNTDVRKNLVDVMDSIAMNYGFTKVFVKSNFNLSDPKINGYYDHKPKYKD